MSIPSTAELAELAGESVDIAPLGQTGHWTGSDALSIEFHPLALPHEPVDVAEQGGRHVGIQWDVPRQFGQVKVVFGGPAPDPAHVKLQWWRHNWPVSWQGGWTAIDDPHNGRWVTVQSGVEAGSQTLTYSFDPLDIVELPEAEDFAVRYRQSYKVRLLLKPGAGDVTVERFLVTSTSTWQRSPVTISFDETPETPNIQIRNGHVLESKLAGNRLNLDLLSTDTSKQYDPRFVPVPPDQTVVTVTDRDRSWSFADEDVGPIRVPEFGVTVTGEIDRTVPVVGSIYDRISAEPEQTYERASREIPVLVKKLQQRYVPLGCDANRQEFALTYSGHVYADKREMKVSGRDCARLLWPGPSIAYKFPTMDPPDFREREDAVSQSALGGHLPIYTSVWIDREIEFTKTDFAALLFESPDNEPAKRGDEPTCLFSRVTIRNTTEDTKTARLWFVIEQPEQLELSDGFVYATGRVRRDDWHWPKDAVHQINVLQPYDEKRLRAHIDTFGKGELKPCACSYGPVPVTGIPNAIAYDVQLNPRSSHTIEFKIPFETFTNSDKESEITAAGFDGKLAEMTRYWEGRIASGATISVPEPDINDFVKATIPHIAITADRDVQSGHYLLPAGTYSYNVCANEAMHQVRSLDFRGLHDQARRYLTPFVVCQGSRPMHGKFKTQEGVLHGLGVSEDTDYQTFNYNLDHGFVLFALCEHYFLTRDKAWAESIAANLIAASDFVTRERQSTMKLSADGQKAPEYGLIPPGHLEDNPEWLYWYAVNAYCYRGMAASARVLADIGHGQANRIAEEAASYRVDLRRSMRLHMERSPVARLMDGTSVPFTPTRAGLYSRDIGWIRESLYGPIHAIECGVLDPCEDQSTWILKDTEDNVFVNRYRGRQVDLENRWFSQGGNTIQSGLLPMAMVYVKRDQPEHAIRCLMNSFAQNIYRDVRCFAEHPVSAFGMGAGPFYKTPDECCWVNWLRCVMLSEIDDDKLLLAPAVPRAWHAHGKGFGGQNMATWFGPVSYKVESNSDSTRLRAVVSPPRRNPPSLLELRLRHPDSRPIRSVTIDGVSTDNFDVQREIVTLDANCESEMVIEAEY